MKRIFLLLLIPTFLGCVSSEDAHSSAKKTVKDLNLTCSIDCVGLGEHGPNVRCIALCDIKVIVLSCGRKYCKLIKAYNICEEKGDD